MSDVLTTVVKGTLYWARTHAEDTTYEGVYGITVGNLSAEAIESLKAIGLGDSVKTSEKTPEQGSFINARSKFPVETVDAEGVVVEGDKNFIGNGSVGTVKIRAFTVLKGANKGRISPKAVKVKVLELVEYSESDDMDEAL